MRTAPHPHYPSVYRLFSLRQVLLLPPSGVRESVHTEAESAAFWPSLQWGFFFFCSLTRTIPGAALWRFRSRMFCALQLGLPSDISYFTRRNESFWHCVLIKKKEEEETCFLVSRRCIRCNSLLIGVFVVDFLLHSWNFCTFSRWLDILDLDFYDKAVIHEYQIKRKLLF